MHTHLLTVVVAAVVAAAIGFGFGQASSPPVADARSSNRAVVRELKRIDKKLALIALRAGFIQDEIDKGFGFTGPPARESLRLICIWTAPNGYTDYCR